MENVHEQLIGWFVLRCCEKRWILSPKIIEFPWKWNFTLATKQIESLIKIDLIKQIKYVCTTYFSFAWIAHSMNANGNFRQP